MKFSLITAILWAIAGICFAILAINTSICGGPIWVGIIQALAAVVDGANAYINWRNWSLERAWNKCLKK
jgi:hypothetical protein